MHLHILGICGTFMAGIAEIAVRLGHRVTGSDAQTYPPMSTFLRAAGIDVHTGYDRAQFRPRPDLVLIGNALSRGNEAVETVLDEHLPYTSGAEWLAQAVLRGRRVIAVSGTHGKTTTTSMIAWILQHAGLSPGFLIGGIAADFPRPAALGDGEYFVIEADEYDTAFFDKRSKFVHYHPDVLLINNLEFDHADIFPDLEAIKVQFHHLLRTVPRSGSVIHPASCAAVDDVLARGCWSTRSTFGEEPPADWHLGGFRDGDPARFDVTTPDDTALAVDLSMPGRHNALNATAAIAAAAAAGVDPAAAAAALARFAGVKRRLEVIGTVGGVTVYDDFAHHPTAIQATLEALRGKVGDARVICVLEPRSNTMRLGVHAAALAPALGPADVSLVYATRDLQWDPHRVFADARGDVRIHSTVAAIVEDLATHARAGDHIVIMSNGGFEGIHGHVLDALR